MLRPRRRLGLTLWRWRTLNGVKQRHAAEIFGVSQSTISRWESGALEIEPEHRAKIEAQVAARLTSAGDAALARLIERHDRGAHLICDHGHTLLALSAVRRREFGCDPQSLMGTSLWPFVTEPLARVEAELETLGWFESPAPPEMVVETGANSSNVVPIRDGRCRLTRLMLSDGAAVRLVETLDQARA